MEPTTADKILIPLRIGDLHLSTKEMDGDSAYQRAIQRRNVSDKLGTKWDPNKVRELRVSCRLDGPHKGKLFVVDGMHRREAALENFGPDYEMLCILSDMTLKEEAREFGLQNEGSTKVPAGAKFNALETAEDPEVLRIAAYVRRHNWELELTGKGGSGRKLGNIAGVQFLDAKYGQEPVEKALEALDFAYPTWINGRGNSAIVEGVITLFAKCPDIPVKEMAKTLRKDEHLPGDLLKRRKQKFGQPADRGRTMAATLYYLYNLRRTTGKVFNRELHDLCLEVGLLKK